MWPVSDRFLAELLLSHQVVTTAQVWRDGVLLVDHFAVTGGTVTVDESSKVRRTLNLSSSDVALDPDSFADVLAPTSTELHVFSGVGFTQGDFETVPVGVFRVQSIDRRGYLAGLEVVGDDRSRAVADARLLVPRSFTGSSTVVEAVTALVTEALPGVEVFDLTGDDTKCPVTTVDRDRWDACLSLAKGIGAEPFFDPAGRLIIRYVPQVDADSTPDWSVAAAVSGASMLDVATGVSGDRVYNAVVATSSAPDVVGVVGIAYQASGPLAWRAGYQRPRFYASPVLRTVAACQSAARAILARSLVYARSVSSSALPNPALDCGDILSVTFPDGVTELRAASRLTVPLYLDAMGVETRVGVDALLASDVGELA